MLQLLLLLQTHEPIHKSPFDSVPKDLCAYHHDDRRVTVVPNGISDSPFGDRAHGMGGVLTIQITLR